MNLRNRKNREIIQNSAENQTSNPKIEMIDVMDIRPNAMQPRKYFDDNGIIRLADSIKRIGIIHPLTVRRLSSSPQSYEYELISGERRLRAAMFLGLSCVPCVVKCASELEAAEMAIIENLLRHDLNFFEQAEAYEKLIRRFGLTQAEVAERLSTGQSSVANKLRLLKLDAEEQQKILEARLTERHARALIRILDRALRREVLDEVISSGLNVFSTEILVEKVLCSLENGDKNLQKPEKSPRKPSFSSSDELFDAVKRFFSRSMGAESVDCLESIDDGERYIITLSVKKP